MACGKHKKDFSVQHLCGDCEFYYTSLSDYPCNKCFEDTSINCHWTAKGEKKMEYEIYATSQKHYDILASVLEELGFSHSNMSYEFPYIAINIERMRYFGNDGPKHTPITLDELIKKILVDKSERVPLNSSYNAIVYKDKIVVNDITFSTDIIKQLKEAYEKVK